MKFSFKKSWVLFTLTAVSTMILLAIMALSQEREPSEKRIRLQRIAASEAIAGQEEVAPPWAYPYQELTFPACAFQPQEDGYDYYAGDSLGMMVETPGKFFAPIILPDYTQIKRVILIAIDKGASGVDLSLFIRTNQGSTTPKMTVSSTGSAASYRRFVSSYVNYSVRNQYRSQWLRVDFPGRADNYVMLMAKILYKKCYWPS